MKLWLRVRGEPRGINAIKPGHPFGYLMTDRLLPDGSQLLIGFGRDSEAVDFEDRAVVQSALDELVPGLEIVDTTTHDWLADEFARGTWAIHRPGWYTRHHAAMRDIGGVTYVNTGDFVESCSFVAEHHDGRLEVLHWLAVKAPAALTATDSDLDLGEEAAKAAA